MCIGLVMFPEHSYFANESIFPLFMAVSSRDGRRMGIRAPHRTAPTPFTLCFRMPHPHSSQHSGWGASGIRTLNRGDGFS